MRVFRSLQHVARPRSSLGLLHSRFGSTLAAVQKTYEVPLRNAHVQPPATQPPTFRLRPYQEECVNSCLNTLTDDDSRVTRIGVSSPTGSGKTTMFCTLISRLPPPPDRPNATQSLILVGSIELARQAAAQLRILCPELTVEIEQGQKHRATGLADVTVATYQTLKQPERLEKFDPSRFKVVVVDEAHHAVAPSYLKVLSYFNSGITQTGPLSTAPDPSSSKSTSLNVPVVGFSATFSRHDGSALGRVFQSIVYHQDFLDMMKDQWLCPVTFTTVSAKIDLSGVTISTKTGDFNPTSLAHIVNTDSINKLVVRTWLDRTANRKSTLVFCVNISHVKAVTAVFREAGVDARYITGSTPVVERKELLDGFRRGEFPVLVNCAILTEGADVPNIDCVIIARPTRSRNLFAQIIGRGMRLSPNTDKTDCRIIDFVDSLNRVGGIVSAPTLFGLEPDEVVDASEEDSEPRESLKPELEVDPETVFSSPRRITSPIPDPEFVTYTDHDDPFSLVADGAGSPHLKSLSPNAWVQCGPTTWVLECLGRGFIKIERLSEDERDDSDGPQPAFEAYFAPTKAGPPGMKRTGSPFMKKRKVMTSDTLGEAIKGCDNYAVKKVVFGPMAMGLLRSAAWRRAPATEAQKKLLKTRYKGRFDEADGSDKGTLDRALLAARKAAPFDSKTLTKGEAANMINRLKHGAQAYYLRRLKTEKQAQIKAEKERRKLEGHVVRVGPLPTSF
ncbi:hypothetical protein M407DRAFT_25721 [Tulasnella calospora MUT 4182]|uniref:P-loop containing nucleoside triphosphate hydrolase protein n=1 Tax=Tulasnella calospora MUT 4182 TaxID=1051891 RepID=A0A0C3QH37_9AGAM|nr:hypothetical protein M407DRAFT_25721 [Tulasnella calospora MUT 4182]